MKKTILSACCLYLSIASLANNVEISNIVLIGSPGNYRIQFDLSWDNGWRTNTAPANLDGVWVFFKYKSAISNWTHLYMNGAGNLLPANYGVYQTTATNKPGGLIQRSGPFTGTSTLSNVELGVADPAGVDLEIRGFAIEMVYIPSCTDCIVGDGDGTTEAINALHVTDNTAGQLGSVFRTDINSFDDATIEAGITISSSGITGNTVFPTTEVFWSMKYEISQAMYRDFLNTLTLTQQLSRTTVLANSLIGQAAFSSSTNNIEVAIPSVAGSPIVFGCDGGLNNNIFDEPADAEWRACTNLAWPDVAAFLDWAGLAPMSEIMFERICRGPLPEITGEYAWGTATVNATQYTYTNQNTVNESVSNPSLFSGNALYVTTSSNTDQKRSGMFTSATSNRITSGASYYGVIEMSGNATEMCVTVGNAAGRSFTGLNGDGVLSSNGNANTSKWPCSANAAIAATCSEVTGDGGIIFRGGKFDAASTMMQTSNRNNLNDGARRYGGRGVLYIN